MAKLKLKKFLERVELKSKFNFETFTGFSLDEAEKGGMVRLGIQFNENTSMNSELKNINRSVENTQENEKNLKERIAMLEEKEAKLQNKKNKLKQKNDNLSERLSKVKTIKDQLNQV